MIAYSAELSTVCGTRDAVYGFTLVAWRPLPHLLCAANIHFAAMSAFPLLSSASRRSRHIFAHLPIDALNVLRSDRKLRYERLDAQLEPRCLKKAQPTLDLQLKWLSVKSCCLARQRERHNWAASLDHWHLSGLNLKMSRSQVASSVQHKIEDVRGSVLRKRVLVNRQDGTRHCIRESKVGPATDPARREASHHGRPLQRVRRSVSKMKEMMLCARTRPVT